jgi:hypothetical protein
VTIFLIALVAVALAAVVYLGFEPQGRAGVLPLGLRTVGYLALGILLVDLSCARPPTAQRPLVLLDASLSMGAAGARWPEAKAAAAARGEVQIIGALGADSGPTGGRSLVAPAVAGALARGRPVWLVTDGEIEDAPDLAPELWARTGAMVFARAQRPDLAITRVAGADRVSVGDTLRLEVDVSGFALPDRATTTIEVLDGTTRWARSVMPLTAGSGTAVIEIPIGDRIAAGAHLLTIALADAADGEPNTDRRLHAVRVLPTPGVVLVAAPGSWESRFLFRALVDVAALPVRGYLAVDPSRWIRMGDFTASSGGEVDQAAARADVLISVGDVAERFKRLRPRGRWEFVATSGAATIDGDWYLVPTGSSPIAGAFVGLPVDSFPPAVALSPLSAGPRDWVGLAAQQNRRGVERPAVVGRDSAGRREVVVGAAGLWRWAFRGGNSEQAYRGWVASTLTWLLGGSDSVTGRARPIRAVVERGRPVVFERLRSDSGGVAIELATGGQRRTDTLEFDGAGRATLALEPGRYDYRLQGGGSGTIGVESYSQELLPRPVVVENREPTATAPMERSPFREQWWLFLVAIVALAGDWWWRRRAGLR